MPDSYEGMRITVMGLGAFGGGAGVTRFLVERGARVTVTDLHSAEKLAKGLKQIEDLPVRLVLGEHCESDFKDVDLVVANPAVPPDSLFLKIAADHNVPVQTEITLFFQHLPACRVIGVTGSNGKTTTSHLIHRMLEASGDRSWLGGNMGGSLLDRLPGSGSGDCICKDDFVVLELSSFQLERTAPQGLGPDVAVFTNLTPNHLDRHKTFDAYVEAKAGVFARARAAVLNAADQESMDRFGRLEIPTLFFSSQAPVEEGLYLSDGYIVEQNQGHEERLLAVEQVDLPGLFNLENLMAALAGVRLIREAGSVPKAAVNAGAVFEGVPHRLEMVATLAGVRYINDSIATTPESCLAALDAVEGTIHLIAGGYDKGLPLDRLAQAIIKSVSTVFLVGETGRALETAILKAAEENGCQCPLLRLSGSLKNAVNEATQVARSGSTVLLSPGFASYDQFLNFEERGEFFRRFVTAL